MGTSKTEKSFTIDTMVILPNRLHARWIFPEGNADFSPLVAHQSPV